MTTRHGERRIVALAVAALALSQLACNAPRPELTQRVRGSLPAAPSVATASAVPAKDLLKLLPNLGYIQHADGKREYFRTDRVAFKPRPGESIQAALSLVRDQRGLKLAAPEGDGLLHPRPRANYRWPEHKPAGKARAPSWRLVQVPTAPPSPQQQARERELIQRKLGPGATFSSPEARAAVGFVLRHNASFGAQRPVVLDFLMFPRQLITDTQETPAWPDYALRVDNFWTMDMRRAWRLAQGAGNVSSSSVRVAVIDQGFQEAPIGLTWSGVLAKADDEAGLAFGDSSPFEDPWHGTYCGSVLGATVNDRMGGAGSALFVADPHVQTTSTMSPVQLIAVAVPDFFAATFATYLLRATDVDAAGGAADIVSISWGMDCGPACRSLGQVNKWSPLADAITVAARRAAVFFAAGNEGVNLDANPNAYESCATSTASDCIDCGARSCPLDEHFVMGCELDGALCVGGLTSGGSRWETGLDARASNFGSALAAWGPADWVVVNPPDSSSTHAYAFGTSMATPFVAGMLALAETTWSSRPAGSTIRGLLTSSARDVSATVPYVSAGVLSGYNLMRQNLVLARDAREPNDTPPATPPSSPTPPAPTEILTLDRPQDHDFLAVGTSECSRLSATFDYVMDPDLGEFQVSLRNGSGELTSTIERPAVGNVRSQDGSLVLSADLCPGTHYLDVHQLGRLTTAYSVRITQVAQRCATDCDVSAIPNLDPGQLQPLPGVPHPDPGDPSITPPPTAGPQAQPPVLQAPVGKAPTK